MPGVAFSPAVEPGESSAVSAQTQGPLPPLTTGRIRSPRITLAPHVVLLKRQGAVQLGIDSPDAVVLTDPDGTLWRLLELLDGRYGPIGLRSAANRLGIDAPTLDQLLNDLAGAGLLQSEADSSLDPAAELAAAKIQLTGSETVGGRLREHLLSVGIGQPTLVNPAEAGDTGFDLTVAISEHLEIDRGLTGRLTRSNQPHLIVRPRFGGAVIGPFVVPGQSSCIRCADLTRARADAAWPMLLAQLCRKPGRWDSLATEWAAATAATQVIAQLTGQRVESESATLELARRPIGGQWSQHSAMQRRNWPVNPACGCGWAPPAQ